LTHAVLTNDTEETMTHPRLHRLFNPRSGRALDIAVDHGIFGEPSFLTGIEDINHALGVLTAAAPDAIQLTPGQAALLQEGVSRGGPALVLRGDVANVYGQKLDKHLFSRHFPNIVEQALRLDAVCIVLNLIQLPNRPEIREQCITSILAVQGEAHRYGMPLMIEPLVMQDNSVAGGYMVDGDVEKIVALVRQAVELGADIVKADPSDDITQYHRVVEAAGGRPLLARGGGRVDDRTLLTRTRALLDQGARGIVYGRNIIQHDEPAKITAALLAILHNDVDVDSASLQGTEP